MQRAKEPVVASQNGIFMNAKHLRFGYTSAQQLASSTVMVSDQLKTRLVLREAVLQLLDRRRAETGDPTLGSAMEKRILDLELADLEMAMTIQERKEDALIRNKRAARRNT